MTSRLADVREVVYALAQLDLGLGANATAAILAVEQETMRKRQERGGFDGLVGMYVKTVSFEGMWGLNEI